MIEENTADKPIIQGPGFTVTDSSGSSPPNRVGVEFRTGATTEEGLAELERKEAEQKQQFLEEAKRLAQMNPEDRAREEARMAEETERDHRSWIAAWFKDGIQRKGEYSEGLLIKTDGSFNSDKRQDGFPQFLVSAGNLNSVSDLYALMRKISDEHPLDISFDVDTSRKWIKYVVKEKLAKPKGIPK